MWHIYTMAFCSAIKKNKVTSLAGKRDGSEDHHIKQNVQTQKDKYHIFSLIFRIYILKKDMKEEG
jgi:uncharacterized ion transporter superfamily protein YfcC